VTVKFASTFTVTSVPSALVMCASYGEPSASFSTRAIVPPGTAASAAARTLVAVSPVRSCSVMPLAVCPPLVGSKLRGGPAGTPLGGLVAVAGAVVLDDAAPLTAGVSTAAPNALPAASAPSVDATM